MILQYECSYGCYLGFLAQTGKPMPEGTDDCRPTSPPLDRCARSESTTLAGAREGVRLSVDYLLRVFAARLALDNLFLFLC